MATSPLSGFSPSAPTRNAQSDEKYIHAHSASQGAQLDLEALRAQLATAQQQVAFLQNALNARMVPQNASAASAAIEAQSSNTRELQYKHIKDASDIRVKISNVQAKADQYFAEMHRQQTLSREKTDRRTALQKRIDGLPAELYKFEQQAQGLKAEKSRNEHVISRLRTMENTKAKGYIPLGGPGRSCPNYDNAVRAIASIDANIHRTTMEAIARKEQLVKEQDEVARLDKEIAAHNAEIERQRKLAESLLTQTTSLKREEELHRHLSATVSGKPETSPLRKHEEELRHKIQERDNHLTEIEKLKQQQPQLIGISTARIILKLAYENQARELGKKGTRSSQKGAYNAYIEQDRALAKQEKLEQPHSLPCIAVRKSNARIALKETYEKQIAELQKKGAGYVETEKVATAFLKQDNNLAKQEKQERDRVLAEISSHHHAIQGLEVEIREKQDFIEKLNST